MRPPVNLVLQEAKQTMLAEILPALESAHGQGTAYVLGVLMAYSAIEYERGAEVRVADIRELRSIFLDAAGRVADSALAAALRDAAQIREASLQIGELDRVLDLLKARFIELHAHVERNTCDWAPAFERRLLDFLAVSLERRALPNPAA